MRLTPEALDAVFGTLADDVAAGRIPLAALAVGDERGLIRKAVVGAGARRQQIDADSLFFLASVTKPIFATGLMQLVEEGALELHAPVARWLVEFATPEKERVTLWHLLTHTSGLADILPEVIRRTRPSAGQLIKLSLAAPVEFEPGTHWQYVSSSFYVLGELVRRVTGQPLRQFLRERLFDPLGMTHTDFDPRGRRRKLVPVHGVGANNRLKRFLLLRYVVSLAHPGGGLWGTLDDVVRFGAALLEPRRVDGRPLPIAPETFALMAEDHVRGLPGVIHGQELPVHHGLAWAKPTLSLELPGSRRVVDHGGATGTRLWIDPDAKLVFVYFSNEWSAERGPELRALRGVYEALVEAERAAG